MKYILILIALFFSSACHAELPDEPTIPDLCKDSKIILAGTIVSKTILSGGNDIKFSLMVVSIDSIYKGKDYIDEFPSDTVVGAEINVLIQKTYDWACPQEANYMNNKKYVFFLEETQLENLFTRNQSVIYFEEFKASKEFLKQIENEISGKHKQKKVASVSSTTQRSLKISSTHKDGVMFFSVENTTDKSINVMPPYFAPASNFYVYKVGSELPLNPRGSSTSPRKELIGPNNMKTYEVEVTKAKKDLSYLIKYRPYGFDEDIILKCISKSTR